MDAALYRTLRRRARQLSRRAADAEDLLQDALLAALEAGRDDPAWLDGVMRRQAALAGRTAARRRAREQRQELPPSPGPDDVGETPRPQLLLRSLPPSARRVAVLALHGLDLVEIQWLLAIAPTALRQRISRIRRALGELPPALRADALALAYVRDPARAADLQFGLVRRALKAALAGKDGLGTHDADGHLLVIRGAHTRAPGGN